MQAAAAAKTSAAVPPKPFSAGDKINEKAQLVFDACWRKLEGKWANVSSAVQTDQMWLHADFILSLSSATAAGHTMPT